jgi:hypothetical protein
MRGTIFAGAVLLTVTANAKEAPLPVPPIPPKQAAWSAAPMPNQTLFSRPLESWRYSVTLDTEINHRTDPEAGLGLGSSTRYQLDNDRRFALPGVMVRIPLP